MSQNVPQGDIDHRGSVPAKFTIDESKETPATRIGPPLRPFVVAGAAGGLVSGALTLPVFIWWRRGQAQRGTRTLVGQV